MEGIFSALDRYAKMITRLIQLYLPSMFLQPGHTAPDTPSPDTALEQARTQEGTATRRARAAPSRLATDLDHKQDLKTLGRKLDEVATRLGSAATPGDVSLALNTTTMASLNRSVTLASFIRSQGLPLPTDHFSLTGLAYAVTHRAMEHPLGNLSGALSWPVPLSADEQTRLGTLARQHTHHLGTTPSVSQTPGGLLEFLRYPLPLDSDTLNSPAKLLDALIDSPQAHLMGAALREGMQGIATPSSDTDYLLAAMTLQLDPESATAPHRNKLAGFDLASADHIGKPASFMVERLGQHLLRQGKVRPQTAAAAAHLLLAGHAPVFLINDIPASVTYGSPAWLNLAVAAATIEAQTPGKVANMSFAQVMQEARTAAVADPNVTAYAQKAALLDWGLANGVVATREDGLYTSETLTLLVDAFTARSALMANATLALDTELPSRREMALAELSKRFPGKEALFEEKVISVTTKHDTYTEGGKGVGYGKLLTGLHSMLDVAMMDLKHPDLVFFSGDSRIPLAELNANTTFGVADRFNQQFAEGIHNKKTAVATTIKHLIAQLPLEDRKNFEYGDLSFFQTTPYALGTGFFDKTRLQTKPELLVSIKRDGVTQSYEISFDKGTIAPIHNWQASARENRASNVVYKTEAFAAADGAALGERTDTAAVPDSFASPRTQAIADTFVKHLDLDHADIKAQARGLTTEDRRLNMAEGVGDFLLNLIPFRSAVINFQKGQYGEGAYDLALDVFGFLTAGAGTIGKAVKIGSSAASTASKAFKVARVIGAATINALNPLAGFGDMAAGGIALMGKGAMFVSAKAVKTVNTLRGSAASYDLLKTISKEHGPTLIGAYTIGDVTTEGVAVLKNNRWYKYDHRANRLYGAPISGNIAATNNTLRSPTGSRHYTVSTFDPADLNQPGVDAKAVENLSDIAL